MHHRYFEGNYGLYFRWWDIWMGTTHPRYDETLQEVQHRSGLRSGKSSAVVSVP